MSLQKSQLFIGIMSGTSVDAIDLALVDITRNQSRFIKGLETPFTDKLRQRINQLVSTQQATFIEYGEVGLELAIAYAEGVKTLLEQCDLTADDIIAIGCHGQTVFHQPHGALPFSLQLLNASKVAELTGIHCVHNFREMDLALSGQGAPLVPLFHQSMLKTDNMPLIVANIGGIANISILSPEPLLGFDTGPGNTLIDVICQSHFQQSCDFDAKLAKQGSVNEPLLKRLLNDPYFKQLPPKSSGREYFNHQWLEGHLAHIECNPIDLLTTLTELTAQSLANEINRYQAGKLILCGGGCKNPLLIERITTRLTNWQVLTSHEVGINSDYMEAMAFAWLAYRTLSNQTSNDSKVTGARYNAVLGQFTAAPKRGFVFKEVV